MHLLVQRVGKLKYKLRGYAYLEGPCLARKFDNGDIRYIVPAEKDNFMLVTEICRKAFSFFFTLLQA